MNIDLRGVALLLPILSWACSPGSKTGDASEGSDVLRTDASHADDDASPGDSAPSDTGSAHDAGSTRDAGSARDASAPQAFQPPGRGAILGFVLDLDTQRPLAGAVVQTGTISVMSDPEGHFSLDLPSGVASLSVSLAGFLGWQGDRIADPEAELVQIRLKRLGAAVSVGAGGGTVTASSATIGFPAGAFPAAVDVSAAFFGQGAIGSAPGPHSYVGVDGIGHQLIGVLHVEVAQQPAMLAMVTLPVRADSTQAGTHLVELGPSGWSNPIAPTSFGGGNATFPVSHFSDYGLTFDLPPSSDQHNAYAYWIVDVMGRVIVEVTDAHGMQVQTVQRAGGWLPAGAVVRTDRGSWLRLSDYSANLFLLFPQTTVALLPLQPMGGLSFSQAGKVHVQAYGWQVATSTSFVPRCARVEFQPPLMEGGIEAVCSGPSQNVVSFVAKSVFCPSSEPWWELWELLGTMTVHGPLGDQTVNPGHAACVGCALLAESMPPACCNAGNCPGGCCTVEGVCATGADVNQCGSGGALCQRCGGRACTGGRCDSRCDAPNATACAPGTLCIDGACRPWTTTGCQSDADCNTGCRTGPGGCRCLRRGDGSGSGSSACTLISQCGTPGLACDHSDHCSGIIDSGCTSCASDDDCLSASSAGIGPPNPFRALHCAPDHICRPVDNPRGYVPCLSDTECGAYEVCSGGVCVACARSCSPGICCSGQQCTNYCLSTQCECFALGNGCATGDCGEDGLCGVPIKLPSDFLLTSDSNCGACGHECGGTCNQGACQ